MRRREEEEEGVEEAEEEVTIITIKVQYHPTLKNPHHKEATHAQFSKE